jgi:stearoyl-CoA desaturase (Delta-9 desaturase)
MSERTYKAWVTFFVVTPFLAVIGAIVLLWNHYVFTEDIILLLVMHFCTAIGVTIGYHRMMTHEGFESSSLVRGLFIFLGSMAYGGVSPPDEWAATHIKHHAHSDQEDDPHSPLDGFWHAHMGWLYSLKDPESVKTYAPHLLKDPVVQFLNKYWYVSTLLAFGIPFAVGGWTGLLWGGFVRLFLTEHTTWSVNSICHCFGKRPFETTDESRNEWIVGLLAFGEGWHNNHHAFPKNAFHGLRWWQFDLSGLIICGLEKIGLIWKVERVSSEAQQAKVRKGESMRETLAEFQEQLSASIAQAKKELSLHLAHWSEKESRPLRFSYEDAMKKLEALQKEIARRKSLRKKKQEEYREEIRNLVAQAKERMRSEMKKLGVVVG